MCTSKCVHVYTALCEATRRWKDIPIRRHPPRRQAVDMHGEEWSQGSCDALVGAACATLPWVGATLAAAEAEPLEALLQAVQEYMEQVLLSARPRHLRAR